MFMFLLPYLGRLCFYALVLICIFPHSQQNQYAPIEEVLHQDWTEEIQGFFEEKEEP
jgi:hypothetical protein